MLNIKLWNTYNKAKHVFKKPKLHWKFGLWKHDPCLPVWRHGPILWYLNECNLDKQYERINKKWL